MPEKYCFVVALCILLPCFSFSQGNLVLVGGGSESKGGWSDKPYSWAVERSSNKKVDTILVVTTAGRAKAFISRLLTLKARVAVLETSAASNDVSQIDLRNSIRDSRKVLFVENSDAALFNFLKNGATGELLEKHIRRNDIASGFIGENSRYAGKIWVSNHLGNALAAYQGKLVYREGLGLLQSTVIMSNTYDANYADFYENTTASVSYAMIHDGLKYGIYLNRDSFLEFSQKSGRNLFQASSDLSTMVMVNEGSKAGFASQAVNTPGDVRNYVSFSSLQYILLNGEGIIDVGNTVTSSDFPYEYEMPIVGLERKIDRSSVNIFPNPSGSGIFYLSGSMPNSFTLSVTDMFGRKLKPGVFNTMNDMCLDLSSSPDGIYLITWRSGHEIVSIRGIKQGTEHP